MNNQLENGKIINLLKKYSIPAMVGNMITIVYNIIDRIFIAKGVGSIGIAGISLSLPIMSFFLAVGLLIGVGSSVLISMSIGQKNFSKAEKLLGNSIALYIIWGIVATIITQVFLTPILQIFGASETTMPYAKEYLRYLLLGTTFMTFVPGFNNIIRAEGSPKVAMFLISLGAILNIILDYIFIFVLNMGIKGAAIATVISMATSGILMFLHFTGKNITIRLKRKNIRLDSSLTKEVTSIGVAPFINHLSTSIIVIFFNKNLNLYGGDLAVAAYGIVNSLILLIRLPIISIQHGSQIIVSFNYGAKKYKRVKETYSLCVKLAFTISCTGFLLAMFIPEVLAGIFAKNDPELMKISVNGIRLFFSLVLFQGFNIISTLFFMSIKKAHISSKLNIIQQFGLLIPLIYILPKFIGINGIWLATPIAEFMLFLFVVPLIYKEIKNLKED